MSPLPVHLPDLYLSETDKNYITRELNRGGYTNDPDLQDVIRTSLPLIIYDPNYIMMFNRTHYETIDDKKYFQAVDKIQRFLQNGIPIVDEENGGKRRRKRRTRKMKNVRRSYRR